MWTDQPHCLLVDRSWSQPSGSADRGTLAHRQETRISDRPSRECAIETALADRAGGRAAPALRRVGHDGEITPRTGRRDRSDRARRRCAGRECLWGMRHKPHGGFPHALKVTLLDAATSHARLDVNRTSCRIRHRFDCTKPIDCARKIEKNHDRLAQESILRCVAPARINLTLGTGANHIAPPPNVAALTVGDEFATSVNIRVTRREGAVTGWELIVTFMGAWTPPMSLDGRPMRHMKWLRERSSSLSMRRAKVTPQVSVRLAPIEAFAALGRVNQQSNR
jgi:hypothetical protein